MMLKFGPLTLAAEKRYNELYKKCAEKSADTSFINIWAWQDKYHFELSFSDDLCWIRHRSADGYIYYPPIGNWRRTDWMELLKFHFPDGFCFNKVPEVLACRLQNICALNVCLENDRDNWEYVYNINDMINLSGRELKNKRQLANHFKEFYNYTYKKLTPEQIPAVREFQKEWLQQEEISSREAKDINTLEQENIAINRVLNDWELLPRNLFGGVLWVEGNIVAYTIGEKVDEDTVMIHFEKGLFSHKGSYQAINRIFLENVGNYKYVNREQDLGIEGLRRAKTEYNPVWFIKKYTVTGAY